MREATANGWEDYVAGMGDRHAGLLSDAERKSLRGAVVAVAGAGGVGGQTALALARLGCGAIRLADCGRFDASNANRQAGADCSTLGRNKAAVVGEAIRAINPACRVETMEEGVTDANLASFLDSASVVIDGIDLYALRIKRDLYDQARARGLAVVSTPILGFGAALAVFDPVRGPSFGKHFGPLPPDGDEKARRRYLQRIAMGFFGILPDLDWGIFAARVYEGKCPSVGTSCMLAGALGALAAVDCLAGTRRYPVIPDTVHVDLRRLRAVRVGPLRRTFFKLRLLARLLVMRQ
jgi:molybdopterin/thiamine biosynthesis adenylyltransferase